MAKRKGIRRTIHQVSTFARAIAEGDEVRLAGATQGVRFAVRLAAAVVKAGRLVTTASHALGEYGRVASTAVRGVLMAVVGPIGRRVRGVGAEARHRANRTLGEAARKVVSRVRARLGRMVQDSRRLRGVWS